MSFRVDNVDFLDTQETLIKVMCAVQSGMSHMGPDSGLNRTRHGDQEPGFAEQIHRIPPHFHHASLLLILHSLPIIQRGVQTLQSDVGLLSVFTRR